MNAIENARLGKLEVLKADWKHTVSLMKGGQCLA